MRLFTRTAVPVGILLLTGACAAGPDLTGPGPFGAPREAAFVDVANHNWADANVFAVRYGEHRRLGTVTSMSSRSFRLPQAWVDQGERVWIRAELIGSDRTYSTPPVDLGAGGVLDVRIQNYLPQSNLMVRRR